jgi:hypothetical protein
MNTTTPDCNTLYTVNELVRILRLSRRSVIRLIEHEPGVLVLQATRERRRKTGRQYRTFRVPQHVLDRIKHKLTQHGGQE